MFFPQPVAAPDGRSAYALLHRPANEERPGIWLSFADSETLTVLTGHRRVAGPEHPWEELKIGAGPPPLRVDEGWLLIHHGVAGELVPGLDLQPRVRYCAGAMLLDAEEVWRVTARTERPLLEPETGEERDGIVPNVVFPTAVDERGDDTVDVYYGMADSRIGVARLTRPEAAPAARSAAARSAPPRRTSRQP